MTTAVPLSRTELRELVLRFTEAFNRDDLDGVMAYFADDALYGTFDGVDARGKPAIRAAFEPQFRGDFGRIRFIEEDLLVDDSSAKAVIRWVCHHDIPAERAPGLTGMKQLFYRTVYGRSFGWQGLDVLHFSSGLIVEKRTYARAKLPLARRDL